MLKNDPIMGRLKLINQGYKNYGEQQKHWDDKKNRPYIILFGNLRSLSCPSSFLASYDGVFIPRGQMQKATFLTMNSVTWSHLVRMQCSSGGTRSVSLYSGHSLVISLPRER